MSTKKYAVIGHPIGHTMSPFIHKRLFELAGIDAQYSVIDIPPQKLPDEFERTLKGLDGFNITIPHKQAIIDLIDELDSRAKLFGSVNTVDKKDIYKGYTTDPDGFLMALKAYDIPLKKRVVIIGTGGVARTMAYEAVMAGCDLTMAVRPDDLQAVASLAGEIMINIGRGNINTCLIDRIDSKPIDLLINATPVGMYPNTDAVPVSDKVIKNCENVFDAVYNPLETQLVKKAKAQGSNAIGGMSMLVWQAVKSHEIWDGSVYDRQDIEKLCADSAEELKKNF